MGSIDSSRTGEEEDKEPEHEHEGVARHVDSLKGAYANRSVASVRGGWAKLAIRISVPRSVRNGCTK